MAFNKGSVLVRIKPVDSKKILKEVREDDSGPKVPVAFRINKALWEKFKSNIGDTSQIKMIERLIKEFLKGLDKK